MSSLRNSLHRRNHKERSQLSHRTRLGFLEKHKDYVLRAKDYHSKQDRIQRLRQKAADRNKDEFYFGMSKQRTVGGVHVQERGNVSLPEDIVKVLKTQDENYIRTMRTAGLKRIDKLKAQLSMLADLVSPSLGQGDQDGAEEELDDEELDVLREAGVISVPSKSARQKSKKGPGHVVFASDTAAAQDYVTNKRRESEPKAAEETADVPMDLGWKAPEEKKSSKGKQKAKDRDIALQSTDLEELKALSTQNRSRLLKELSARLARDQQLRYAERELEMQKLMMGKGGRKKMHGVEKVEGDDDGDADEDVDEDDSQSAKKAAEGKLYRPRVYKWRMERKR